MDNKNIFQEMYKSTLDYVDQNDKDFNKSTNPEYNRQDTIDKINNWIENTNWENESKYHNTYYLGKGKYGTRTLKSKKNVKGV